MRVGSLFSGVGGLDLGLERAGMHVAWQVERDPYCLAVLRKHWPDITRYTSIEGFLATIEHPIDQSYIDWLTVDLICGGFPCQPVSRAGKKFAQADDRWLWPHFARIVRVLRPRYVLVENVPGLLAHGMGDVLGELAALGFDAEWESITAASVGAPHLRDRVFILAYAQGERRELRTPAGQRSGRSSGRGTTAVLDDALCGRYGPPEGTLRAGWEGPQLSGWWASEPDVGRVADGVPSRVDRLRCLGNAVVPQVAEWIGRRLMEIA